MPVLIAVGDIAPDRDDPNECFTLARERIQEGDVAFCQLECNLTTRGTRMPQARHTHRAGAEAAHAIKAAGFDVVSFAGNHCMDWGPVGLADTISNLDGAGLEVVGVGENIAEARRPVVRDVDGVKIAFLACSSILPAAYWANENRPGCVPLRAHTLYEQIELDQPGTAARIRTWPHAEDLDALCADIAAAQKIADVVIVSLHWGIHFVPAVLADYQREVAHAVIDAGADMILGHHAHILKGIEVYRGKAIFYSLSNFAIDLRMTPEHAASESFREIQSLAEEWEPNFDSLYNFPPDSRMTVLVRASFDKTGVAKAALIPAFINDNAQPEILQENDDRFRRIIEYLDWCCDHAGFATELVVGDGLIQVGGVSKRSEQP